MSQLPKQCYDTHPTTKRYFKINGKVFEDHKELSKEYGMTINAVKHMIYVKKVDPNGYFIRICLKAEGME